MKEHSLRLGRARERIMHILFLVAACASVAAVALICAFLFANSIPAFVEIGPLNFLLGTVWRPGNDLYGIFPMIMGSLYVTAGALLLGVPIALLTAIFRRGSVRPGSTTCSSPRSTCWRASRRSYMDSSGWWCWCRSCATRSAETATAS